MGEHCAGWERRELGLGCGPSLGPSPPAPPTAETSSEHAALSLQPSAMSPHLGTLGLLGPQQAPFPPALGSPSCSPTAFESPLPLPTPRFPPRPCGLPLVGSPGYSQPCSCGPSGSPSLSSLPSPPPPRLAGSSQAQSALVCPVSLSASCPSLQTLRAPLGLHSSIHAHAQRPRL